MIDEFWPGGPKFYKSKDAFPIGTDSVLLSSFCSAAGALKCCDLGSGSGVLGILLALRYDKLSVDGIEISEKATEVSRLNAELNGISDRYSAICGDIRDCREILTAGSYDVTVSNPPYYAGGSGKLSAGDAAFMRGEVLIDLEALISAAAYVTRYGGKFFIVHKPERAAELIYLLSSSGLEPKRIRMVQNAPDSQPSLILIESRRGGKPGVTFEKPLIMTAPDGGESDEIKAIYHRRME